MTGLEDQKAEKARLQNLHLKLKIWKDMKALGFTLDQFRDATTRPELKMLEVENMESTVETVTPPPDEWIHNCESAGRDVTLPIKINVCHLCNQINKPVEGVSTEGLKV